MGQLKLGNLKFDLFARYAGKVLTPIELEGFATSKAQGDETTLARGLRLELFGIFPLSGKGTHSVIRPGKAQSDQIPVHAAQVSAQLLCLFVLESHCLNLGSKGLNLPTLSRAGYCGSTTLLCKYLRTVFLDRPLRRAISRIDAPSRKCQRRIALNIATFITP